MYKALLVTLITVVHPIEASVIKPDDSSHASQIADAKNALIQGDSRQAAIVLATSSSLTKPWLELAVLHSIWQEDVSAAVANLEKLLALNPSDPDIQAFAGNAYREIGHIANLFAKRGYYKKAVAAMLKAGVNAPDDPQYLTLRASAMGQSKSYGGSPREQLKLTTEIVSLSKKWGYIAQINLAQNQDNDEQGKSLAQQAVTELPQDFDIRERVAQFYWTLGDRQQAQSHFLAACQATARDDWFSQVKWTNACYQVASFAEEEKLPAEKGILALTLLLQKYSLPTRENLSIARLFLDISNQTQAATALAFIQNVANNAPDEDTKTRANRLLKRYQ